MLKDIARENGYKPIWDTAIIDAIEYGVMSCARVEKVMQERYSYCVRFIDKAIEYGYFDERQHPLITVEEYKEMMVNRK